MAFYVYILTSEQDGSLYTGQTNDLGHRLQRHNSGCVKSTKSKRPYKLRYFEEYSTRSEAMCREWQLKKECSTDHKKKLIREFRKESIDNIMGL
jgi:putative endonuclease